MCCSKKRISSHQLHRVLGVSYRAAWFISHRIREAMKDGKLSPLGGERKIVEADEPFIGRKKDAPFAAGYQHKMAVLTMIERGGRAQSHHVEAAEAKYLRPLLKSEIEPQSLLMTDDPPYYRGMKWEFAGHEAVRHGIDEYVRGIAHTNTAEGFFSVFKRGMKGTYQHCGEKHLHRYLAEFDFRYNNRIALGIDDSQRANRALIGARGRRLTYKQPVNGG
jgi:transposase-like protein